jgi:hypothetical protein
MFFHYQPELFHTINIVQSYLLWSMPITLVIGIAFIIAQLISWLLSKFFKFSKIRIFILITGLAWLPLALNFFYNSLVDFNLIKNFIGASEEMQIIWRSCNFDKNYQTKKGLCNLYSFTKTIKEKVPPHAKLRIFSTNLDIYLKYYLVDDYQITETNDYDYLITYRTPATFFYDNGKLYNITDNHEELLGSFINIYVLDNSSMIFKRN